MNKLWFQYPKLRCVVLCAGEGSRMLSLNQEPKAMFKIKNKPILGYIVDYWKQFTKDFIFVVGYKKEMLIKFVKRLSINSRFIEQKRPNGIAHALMCTKNVVSERFIVVLGDCICKGRFNFPLDMQQGIGVCKTENIEDIKQSYSIEIKGDYIYRVKEKPKRVTNNLCGLGFYFFDKRVFNYIKMTKPSKLRNEIEITDVIQNMINTKELIRPIFFKGKYLNITYPEDIYRAEVLLT